MGRRHMTSFAHCPWCGNEFEPLSSGGHAKRFCGAPCKNAWNRAARALGADMERKGVLNLRAWYEQNQTGPNSVVHDAELAKRLSEVGG